MKCTLLMLFVVLTFLFKKSVIVIRDKSKEKLLYRKTILVNTQKVQLFQLDFLLAPPLGLEPRTL